MIKNGDLGNHPKFQECSHQSHFLVRAALVVRIIAAVLHIAFVVTHW